MECCGAQRYDVLAVCGGGMRCGEMCCWVMRSDGVCNDVVWYGVVCNDGVFFLLCSVCC